MSTSTLLYLLLISWLIYKGFPFVLLYLNQQSNRKPLPPILRPYFDANRYKQTQKLKDTQTTVKLISLLIQLALGLFLIYDGYIGKLATWVHDTVSIPYLNTIFFSFSIACCIGIIRLPIAYWQKTLLPHEERQKAAKLYKTLTSYATLGLLCGIATVCLEGLYHWFSAWFGVVAFMIMFTLRFLLNRLLRLATNKSSLSGFPLKTINNWDSLSNRQPIWEHLPANGTLATSLEKACEIGEIDPKQVFTFELTNKKNSIGHAFAWKGGIYLSSMVLKEFSHEEIIAIFYHELSHLKNSSLVRGMIKIALWFALYTAVGFMIHWNFSAALGSLVTFFPLKIIGVCILVAPMLFIIKYIDLSYSRYYEWQADVFAHRKADKEALGKALGKISSWADESVHPHPWHVRFYATHPPIIQRIAATKADSEASVAIPDDLKSAFLSEEDKREDLQDSIEQILLSLGEHKSEKEKKEERNKKLKKRGQKKADRIKRLRKKK